MITWHTVQLFEILLSLRSWKSNVLVGKKGKKDMPIIWKSTRCWNMGCMHLIKHKHCSSCRCTQRKRKNWVVTWKFRFWKSGCKFKNCFCFLSSVLSNVSAISQFKPNLKYCKRGKLWYYSETAVKSLCLFQLFYKIWSLEFIFVL